MAALAFLAVGVLSLTAVSGGYPLQSCSAQAPHWTGSLAVEHRLQVHGLHQLWLPAQLSPGMWYLPRPRIKHISSALIGRLPTTGPQWKSSSLINFFLHFPLPSEIFDFLISWQPSWNLIYTQDWQTTSHGPKPDCFWFL